MNKPSEKFEQAYDNFLAGCDVDTTMLDCAEFMFNAGRESVGQAEPVSDDESMWCNYIAWMICTYLNDDSKQKAIAGIIERRLWNFPREAQPAAVDHSGLIKRIDAAIERVTQGRGLMSIPADPRSDVDLVLSECKALLQGENPPFWATDFHPAQPVATDVAQSEILFEAGKAAGRQEVKDAQSEPDFWSWVHKAYREPESTNFTIHNMEVAYQAGRVAQPVQPAGAQGEPVAFSDEDLEGIARKLLADEYESYCAGVSYPSYASLARSGCGEFTLRSIRAIVTALNYTHRDAQPAAAINEQMLEALNTALSGLKWYHAEFPDTVGEADYEAIEEIESAIAAAEAEKAKGGL